MFGKKKEITQKFIVENEDELEYDYENEPKRDKNKNAQPKNTDNNFIFYGSDNKFTKQLEIYATLKGKNTDEIQNSKNKKLVLVVVDSNSPMELLSYKICETFGQFPEYQNLEGLTATNLTKMDEEKKNLPLEGKVGDVLRNGDIIYLDLISNEIWIKTNITMSNVTNKNLKLNISLDIKVKRESSFKELRHSILKSGIICFVDKFYKAQNNFHYIVTEFSISTSAHGNIEENKIKTFDEMKIKQLFSFKNSMRVQIKFYPIEFVLFQKLKTIPRPKKEKNPKKKILWDKFKVLRFRDLLYNKKYIREKEYIFNYIRNLIRSKALSSKCYIYFLSDDINSTQTEDADDNKYDRNEDDKDISNININNEVDGVSADIFDIESGLKKKNSNLNKSSLLNKSRGSKTSYAITSSFSEDNRCTLIIAPPSSKDDDNDTSFINKKYGTKEFELMTTNVKDDNDEDEDEEDNEILIHKTRKNSLYNKIAPKKKYFGDLQFEIIDKDDCLEKDDEMIIYKELKPKQIVKNPKGTASNKWGISNKLSLCKDFDKYFDREKFIDYISGLYFLNIQKGGLEQCGIPNFRGFKIVEKKNKSLNINKRRRKRKLKFSVSFYKNIFPVKRLNFEIGIFSIFIFGIFIFLSYLLSNTYY